MHGMGLFSWASSLADTGMRITGSFKGEMKLLTACLWTIVGDCQLESPNTLQDGYASHNKALRLQLEASEAGLIEPTHSHIANSYTRLVIAAECNGLFEEAAKFGEKSIELLKDGKEEQMEMLAMSYHAVGLAYLTLGQLDKSDEALKAGAELANKFSKSMSREQQLYGRPLPNISFFSPSRGNSRTLGKKANKNPPKIAPYKQESPIAAVTCWRRVGTYRRRGRHTKGRSRYGYRAPWKHIFSPHAPTGSWRHSGRTRTGPRQCGFPSFPGRENEDEMIWLTNSTTGHTTARRLRSTRGCTLPGPRRAGYTIT